jgi:serine/threonine protein kinase
VASLNPGMIIGGHYKLGRLLCEGGMGDIWLADNLYASEGAQDRVVAVKAIKRDFTTDVGSTRRSDFIHTLLRRFELERNVHARLVHRCVAKFFASGRLPSGIPFIVMEYVTGKTFAAEIFEAAEQRGLVIVRSVDGKPRRCRLDPNDVTIAISGGPVIEYGDLFAIFDEILDTFSYFHNLKGEANGDGITHRDMKTANVMIQRERDESFAGVKILDFGIIKAAESVRQQFGIKTELTREGSVIGTATYMPREQFLEPKKVGPRVDVYAIGIMLFEAVSGLEPHANCDNEAQIMAEKLKATEPFDPAKYVRGVPPKLRELVMKATAPEAADRYANAHEMWRDFRRARHEALDFLSGGSSKDTICSQVTVQSDGPVRRQSPRPSPLPDSQRSNRRPALQLIPPPPVAPPPVPALRVLPPPAPPSLRASVQTQASAQTRRPSRKSASPRRTPTFVVAAMSLAVGIGVGGYWYFAQKARYPDRPLPVPEIFSFGKKPAAEPGRTSTVIKTVEPKSASGAQSGQAVAAARSVFNTGMVLYRSKQYGMALRKFRVAAELAARSGDVDLIRSIDEKIADCEHRR